MKVFYEVSIQRGNTQAVKVKNCVFTSREAADEFCKELIKVEKGLEAFNEPFKAFETVDEYSEFIRRDKVKEALSKLTEEDMDLLKNYWRSVP